MVIRFPTLGHFTPLAGMIAPRSDTSMGEVQRRQGWRAPPGGADDGDVASGGPNGGRPVGSGPGSPRQTPRVASGATSDARRARQARHGPPGDDWPAARNDAPIPGSESLPGQPPTLRRAGQTSAGNSDPGQNRPFRRRVLPRALRATPGEPGGPVRPTVGPRHATTVSGAGRDGARALGTPAGQRVGVGIRRRSPAWIGVRRVGFIASIRSNETPNQFAMLRRLSPDRMTYTQQSAWLAHFVSTA